MILHPPPFYAASCGEFDPKRLKNKSIKIDQNHLQILINYWSMEKRVEESASDVLGILTTGPSLAIGCIGYFRGVSKDKCLKTIGPYEDKKKSNALVISEDNSLNLELKDLSKKVRFSETHGILGKNHSSENKVRFELHDFVADPHPITVLRPFLMAEVINSLNISDNSKAYWTKNIEGEVLNKEFVKEKFIQIIQMDTQKFPYQRKEIDIPFNVAIIFAKTIANIITTTKLSEYNCTLAELFKWTMEDEKMVGEIRNSYRTNNENLPRKASARHIVAAAVIESTSSDANIDELFQKMKKYLIRILNNH